MKIRLPSSISSLQDVASLTLEIKTYARWFSHNSIKHQVHAKHASPPPALSPAALEIIRTSSDKKLLSQSILDDIISSLEKFRRDAPSLTITLAAPPTSDIKHSLVDWARDNIADNVLVNFQFNATLLGGMVVRYGSHIFDWSFRRQILTTRAKFPEVLRRV